MQDQIVTFWAPRLMQLCPPPPQTELNEYLAMQNIKILHSFSRNKLCLNLLTGPLQPGVHKLDGP